MKQRYKKYTKEYMKYLEGRIASPYLFSIREKIPLGSWKYHK